MKMYCWVYWRMKVTGVEELKSVRWVTQMKQILLQKAVRESGAKGFCEL